MLTIKNYVRASSLEEAFELNQKSRSGLSPSRPYALVKSM